MTFLEIQNAVYRIMRDPNKTKFDLQTVKDRINEGEERYCVLTKYTEKKDTSYNTAIAQQEYVLPTDYGDIDAVFYNGNRLYETKMEYTVYPTPNNGTPTSYYVRQTSVGLDPIPSAIGPLTIIYHNIGGSMVADADVPSVPKEDHYLLVSYAAFKCAVEADDNRATTFYQEYVNGISQAKLTTVEKAFEQFPVVDGTPSNYRDPNRDNEGMPWLW
jgi:hypothetical protein